jgi:hypothetical protein
MKAKVQQRCLNKKFALVDNEKRFKRECEQIVQLNYSLAALQQRYNKEKKDNHMQSRYSLRFRKKVCGSERNRFRSLEDLQ